MKNIAVFVSGNGTNLAAIIESISKGRLKADLRLVVSDKKDAFALRRAEKASVKSVFLDPKKYISRLTYEKALVALLAEEKIDLVVLAGFMRILSGFFVKKYKNRIVNIHPALLPSFKGAHAIKDAFTYGVKVTGVTVHLVDEKIDHGPVVLQEALVIDDKWSLKDLEERIHRIEHRIYVEAIKLLLGKKYSIKGRKVVFISR